MKYKNGTEAKVNDQVVAVITTSVPTGEVKVNTDKSITTLAVSVTSVEVGTLTDFDEKDGTAILVTSASKADAVKVVKVADCYSIVDAIKALTSPIVPSTSLPKVP